MLGSAIALNGAHYGISNDLYAFRLDGQQQAFVGGLVSQTAQIATAQWNILGVPKMGYISNAFALGAGLRVALPILKFIAVLTTAEDKGFLKDAANRFCEISTDFERFFDKVNDVIAPHIDKICLVSAVAMLVFGHTAFGLMGILTCIVLEVKHRNMLPDFIDTALTPLSILSMYYGIWMAPSFTIVKILGSVVNTFQLINYLISSPLTRDYMPKFLTDATLGKHIINDKYSLGSVKSKCQLQGILQDQTALRINTTSVHNDTVSDVLPKEALLELGQVKYEDLYADIERRLEENNIKLLKQDGWSTLKSSMINGTCPDTRPADFGTTRSVVKAILIELRDKECTEEFERVAQEPAELGTQCSEGWTREIAFMLNPQSKDYKWQAFYEFAQFRGHLIKETLLKYASKLRREVDSDILGLVGGENDVHLTNQVQTAMGHRWESYDAKAFYQIHGRSFLTRWLQRSWENEFNEDFTNLDEGLTAELFRSSFLAALHIQLPLPVPPLQVCELIDREAKSKFTEKRLVETIYDAIKPTYTQVLHTDTFGKKQYHMVPSRRIEWQNVMSWIQDINGKLNEECKLFSEESLPTRLYGDIIEKDREGEQYLTKKGVRLFLFDLGILEIGRPIHRPSLIDN